MFLTAIPLTNMHVDSKFYNYTEEEGLLLKDTTIVIIYYYT